MKRKLDQLDNSKYMYLPHKYAFNKLIINFLNILNTKLTNIYQKNYSDYKSIKKKILEKEKKDISLVKFLLRCYFVMVS